MSKSILIFLTAIAIPLTAQVAPRRPTVRAAGEGVVNVKPDQARITVSVQTRGNSGQEAGDQNSQQTTAVMNSLRQVLGTAAELRTIGYSVNPQYRYPAGGDPVLTGYLAVNSIEATINDVNLVGRVLDAATQGGATNVGGVRFTLKDPAPARTQALRLATMQAKAYAEAIAQGLGMRLGTVVSAEDSTAVRTVTPVDTRTLGAAGPAATTPIETGTLEVRASVSLEVEMN